MDLDRELILQAFLAEADEHLAAIEEGLVALEATPGDAEQLHELFRRAHTLKGAATCIGLDQVASCAHTLEDVLERLRQRSVSPDASLVTLLLNAADGIRKLIPTAAEGLEAPAPAHRALVEWLASSAGAALAPVEGSVVPAPPGRNAGHLKQNGLPFAPSEGGVEAGVEGALDSAGAPLGPSGASPRACPTPAVPGPKAGPLGQDGVPFAPSAGGVAAGVEGALDSAGALLGPSGASPRACPTPVAPGPASEAAAPVRTSEPGSADLGLALERRTLRVDVAKLDRMLNLAGEIAVARGRLSALIESLDARAAEAVRDAHRDADRLFLELQEQVMRARMVAVGPTFRQHLRTVRDAASACGKQARLRIEGADVEVDTAIVDGIRDPLTHMVRNAVAHGIETPAERRALGKDPVGTVVLRAAHVSGQVVVEVRDDGAGLSRERIAARARALGLASAPEAMSDSELFELVFRPGFSTAGEVTELSGRGVGLDVARRAVEALRGTIALSSEPGQGSCLTLRLPLTLAIIEGFSVEIAGETFILPLESVVECLELPPGERATSRGRGVLSRRGRPLPFLRLRSAFGIDGAAPSRESVVVVRHGDGAAGLVVDALLGEGQVVIKPLAALVRGAPGVTGSALLGSGRVALILDPGALLSRELAQVPGTKVAGGPSLLAGLVTGDAEPERDAAEAIQRV